MDENAIKKLIDANSTLLSTLHSIIHTYPESVSVVSKCQSKIEILEEMVNNRGNEIIQLRAELTNLQNKHKQLLYALKQSSDKGNVFDVDTFITNSMSTIQ